MNFQLAKDRLIASLKLRIDNPMVIEALARVPRHYFVPEHLHEQAYEDCPLSIGYNQTISQPYIVALMTEALDITKEDRVLELGTGSGYQTAILAELAGFVVSVERVPQLISKAKKILIEELKYSNIELHLAEKILGWVSGQPYNAIIVTAAAPNIPQVLINQLEINGRMVIPIGSRWDQSLIKIVKYQDHNEIIDLGGCRFVPLIGEGSWSE